MYRLIRGAVAGGLLGGLIGCLPCALLWLAFFYDPPGNGREMVGGLSVYALAIFVPPGALLGAIIGAILASKLRVPATEIRDDATSASDLPKETHPSITVLRDEAGSGPILPKEADTYFDEEGGH